MTYAKSLVGLKLLISALSLFTISGSVAAKAPEWSYSYEIDNFTLSISSSPCYEDNEKATMSMRLYGSNKGATISADASCDCGEAIVIDGGAPITPQSFARLVSDAVSTNIKSYRCEAVKGTD